MLTCRVDRGDVVDAGPPLVLLIHAVEPDEVLLRMTGDLQPSAIQHFELS